MAVLGNLIVKLTADVTRFERQMGQAAKIMRQTEREFERAARNMERTGQSLTTALTLPLLAIGVLASKAAIEWEDAFAGVRKTVNGTADDLAQIERQLLDMTEQIPATHRELAQIAESAGQLGIQKDAIVRFTRVMADMAVTTDFAGDVAATTMARFANIMGTSQRNFDRMGSTIVALGNTMQATESQIAEMSMRIAAAGRVVGLTEPKVLALGAALASTGMEAEAGGSAISRVIIDIANAVAQGGPKVTAFARVAGVTADQFATAWRQDAAGALVSVIEGLRRVSDSGGNVFAVVDALGLSEIRVRDALLRAANAGDLFRRALEIGTQAWEENAALTKEAEERYRTLAAQLQIARNRLYNVAIAFGQILAPYINSALDAAKPFLDALRNMAIGFSRLPRWIRSTVVGLTLFVGLIGPAIWMTSTLYRTMASVLALQTLWVTFGGRVAFAFTALRGGAATLREALVYVAGGAMQLRVIGIIGLVAATLYLAANWEQFAGFAARVWAGISAAVLYAGSLIVRGVWVIVGAFSAIIPALRPAADALAGWADSLKASAASALNVAKSAQAASAVQQAAESAQQVTDVGYQAAASQEALGEAMDEAAKAANKNIMAFDQVHNLQEEMSGTAGGIEVPGLEIPEIAIPEVTLPGGGVMAAIGEEIQQIAEQAASVWQRASHAISQAWQTLLEKAPWLQTAIDGVNTAIAWIRDNWPAIEPVLERVAGLASVVGIGFLAASGPIGKFVAAAGLIALAAGWIIENWETVGPFLTGLWQGVVDTVGPIWETLKTTAATIWNEMRETVIAVWGEITLWWQRWGPTVMAILGGIWNGIVLIVRTAIDLVGSIIGLVLSVIRLDWESAWGYVVQIGQIVWDFIAGSVENLWQTVVNVWGTLRDDLAAIGDSIRAKTEETWTGLTTWLNDTWNGIKATANAIWTGMGDTIAGWWESIKTGTQETWNTIGAWLGESWDGISTTAATIWSGIYGTVTSWWSNVQTSTETTWNEISGKLSEIWTGIKNTASDIWNTLVDNVKGSINNVIGKINSFLDRLSSIQIKIPKVEIPLVGTVGGGTIRMPDIPRIPMLAEGGHVVGRGLAMVGEAGPEILELPRGARVTPLSGGGGGDLADEIGNAVYMAMRAALRERDAGNRRQATDQKELVLQVDRHTLGRIVWDALETEMGRRGVRLREV